MRPTLKSHAHSYAPSHALTHAPINSKGFTLLELMIAISIFSMLAVGSYTLLSAEITAQDRLQKHSSHLYHWQKGMRRLQSDFSQAQPRMIREEYGDKQAAFKGRRDEVSFTRAGWANPLQHSRSTLQRIGYEVDSDDNGQRHLWRIYWPVLDRGQDSEPVRQKLLTDIDEIDIRYRDIDGKWFDKWPPQSFDLNKRDKDLPVAVKMTLDSESLGEITRIFAINRMYEPEEEPEEGEETDSDQDSDENTNNSQDPNQPQELDPNRAPSRGDR